MPRLIVGSNWFFGFSHTSRAKDSLIRDLFNTPSKVADVVEVFARAGCNAFMSMPSQFAHDCLQEVEQRSGIEMIWVATPSYEVYGDPGTWKASVDLTRELGATFCFPHQNVTDCNIDRQSSRVTDLLHEHLAYVRECGMIPGLSTHMPEAITASDACGADVESYVQPYNAAGFLCQVETDWIGHIIRSAKHPVMTIKPLAAGRLMPPTGLAFVWNTIRDIDMVTVGTMSVYEAEEVLEISRSILEQRAADVELQFTRSKLALTPQQ